MEETKPFRTLDVRGLACPIPVTKTSQAIKDIPIGGILEVLATDPGALMDIPAWAKSTGNEVTKVIREGNIIKIYVRRLR
ncbi:MAG: sulfurtransferase TusA family protein [Candidatus Methanomethylicia archaeon]